MTKEFKDELWRDVIAAKIRNQAQVIKICNYGWASHGKLLQYAEEVTAGDYSNREGLAAKMFFKTLYGSNFIRMADDVTNYALNYGYAIIRSSFAKTLCAYGYNSVLGIHHINDTNPFNLADDLMEPLRPIVDLWVDLNHEDLHEELTPTNKRNLANIVNELVFVDNKKMKVRNAIDRYVNSLTSVIEKNNPSLLKIPTILNSTFDEIINANTTGDGEDD